MPDCVAHYQFGQELLGRFDEHLKSCVLAYKREYDVGLQGPDLFFFYQPYHKTAIAAYGNRCHEQPAIKMFRPILAQLREKAVLAYLIGLICHYTLDACCHPYVNEHSRNIADHHRMEAAYDRHILTWHRPVSSRHLLSHTTGLDFDGIAALWSDISPEIIRACLKSRRFCNWLLDHQSILLVLETIAGKRGVFSPLSLPRKVSEEQQEHVRRLDELYAQALDIAKERIERAYRVMGTALEQLAGFEMNHEGEIVHE